MWRSCFSRSLTMAIKQGKSSSSSWSSSSWVGSTRICPTLYPQPLSSTWRFSTSTGDDDNKEAKGDKENAISLEEVKTLMRLVNVESLKTKLGEQGKEVIGYQELIDACESMGVTRSRDEAKAYASVLDDAGVVLLFRDKVYLHPDKVVDQVRRSVPLALSPDNDPRRGELKRLEEAKEEIDRQAHKQVRVMLWSGLMVSIMQLSLFFRLTFWEFSWDVMEPIAFFTTTSGIVIGYAYFMFTSKDPSYQDLMKTLFVSRQRKLFKKYKFDANRFKELNDKCKISLDRKKQTFLLEDAA